MKIRLSDEDRALLWLNITLGSGTARVRKMLDAFDGSAAEAFRAAAKNEIPQFKFLNDERRLLPKGLGAVVQQLAQVFVAHRRKNFF